MRLQVTEAMILTLMLMPGCALVQTPTEIAKPAAPSSQPQPAAVAVQPILDPRLDAIAQRLEHLERILADGQEQRRQRRRWEEGIQRSLQDLRQEVRDARHSVASVKKRRRESVPVPGTPLEESDGKPVAFWAVDAPLGELPNNNGQRETRRIPALVPDKAREILVYAQVATGYVKGGAHRFRIAVQSSGHQEAAFYLYAVGQPQQSWSYNSDNVWLPMPKNRELILQAEGEPLFGDWKSEVRIIAYR